MAPAPRPPLPAILLANDLREGDVVFLSADGWTRDPARAQVAESEEAARRLEAAAAAAMAANLVLDAYLVDVTPDRAGRPVPNHFRERFKMLGPSVRPDLGKQAEFAKGGGVDDWR